MVSISRELLAAAAWVMMSLILLGLRFGRRLQTKLGHQSPNLSLLLPFSYHLCTTDTQKKFAKKLHSF